MPENFYIKVYWIIRLRLYQITNLLKTLFLVSSKEEKSDKKEFDTNFVEIIVTIIFVQKYFSSSSEIFATVLFTDT